MVHMQLCEDLGVAIGDEELRVRSCAWRPTLTRACNSLPEPTCT